MFPQPDTSYSDPTAHIRVITDVISLLDPSDAPTIDALGGLDGASSKFRFTGGESTKVEWLEDFLSPLTDTLDGAIDNVVVEIGVITPEVFQRGHIIQIDDEQSWVSEVNNTTKKLTVMRGVAGTTPAAHSDTAEIKIVGMARTEGAESDTIGLTEKYTNYNVTQILHKEVKVPRSKRQLAQYGISDEMAYQGDKIVPELVRLLERHLFYNKARSDGSIGTPRIMGGIRQFVTKNIVSGASLAKSQFETAVRQAYEAGGTGPWIAPVAPINYTKIDAWYENADEVRVPRSENTVGMVIKRIITPFGDVNLLLDRWAKQDEIPILDPKHCGMKTYYPFTQEPLAKGGDYERTEVVGEFTLCIRHDAAHALLENVS